MLKHFSIFLLALLLVSIVEARTDRTWFFDTGNITISPIEFNSVKATCLKDGTNCPGNLSGGGGGGNFSYFLLQASNSSGTTPISNNTIFSIIAGNNIIVTRNGTSIVINSTATGGGSGVIQGAISTDRYVFVVNASVLNISLNTTALAINCTTGEYSSWNGSQFICFIDNATGGLINDSDARFRNLNITGALTSNDSITGNNIYSNYLYSTNLEGSYTYSTTMETPYLAATGTISGGPALTDGITILSNDAHPGSISLQNARGGGVVNGSGQTALTIHGAADSTDYENPALRFTFLNTNASSQYKSMYEFGAEGYYLDNGTLNATNPNWGKYIFYMWDFRTSTTIWLVSWQNYVDWYYPLHVYNGITMFNNTGISANYILGSRSNTAGNLTLQSTNASGSGDFVRITGGNNGATEIARFTGTGRVGVRTAVPSVELEVNGTINATNILVGGKSICLGDGTNCPGVTNGTGNGTGNGITNGSDAYLRDLNITRDLNVTRNLNVSGNITVGEGIAAYYAQFPLAVYTPFISGGFSSGTETLTINSNDVTGSGFYLVNGRGNGISGGLGQLALEMYAAGDASNYSNPAIRFDFLNLDAPTQYKQMYELGAEGQYNDAGTFTNSSAVRFYLQDLNNNVTLISVNSSLTTIATNLTIGPGNNKVARFTFRNTSTVFNISRVANSNLGIDIGNPQTKLSVNGNISLPAPNGTMYNCGVNNTGGWSCSFLS